MGFCVIHCGIHPPPKCQIHCGLHCQVHCGIHLPPIDDIVCKACEVNPLWPIAEAALRKAKKANLITRDDWQSLLDLTIYTATEVNAIAGIIAASCGNCLTKKVFG